MCFCERLERGVAEEARRRVTHRHHRRRTRQAVEGRKLTDDGASTEEGKNALGAGVRNHRNLKQSVFDAR
jgi:hypothetical protein